MHRARTVVGAPHPKEVFELVRKQHHHQPHSHFLPGLLHQPIEEVPALRQLGRRAHSPPAAGGSGRRPGRIAVRTQGPPVGVSARRPRPPARRPAPRGAPALRSPAPRRERAGPGRCRAVRGRRGGGGGGPGGATGLGARHQGGRAGGPPAAGGLGRQGGGVSSAPSWRAPV